MFAILGSARRSLSSSSEPQEQCKIELKDQPREKIDASGPLASGKGGITLSFENKSERRASIFRGGHPERSHPRDYLFS